MSRPSDNSPPAGSTYPQEFLSRARAVLQPEVYQRLHLQARGAAGGRKSRPKPAPLGRLRAVRFDPKQYDAAQAEQWATANQLAPGEWVQQAGQAPLRTIGPGAQGQPTTDAPLAPGVTGEFVLQKGKQGSRAPMASRVAKRWRAFLRTLADEATVPLAKGESAQPRPDDAVLEDEALWAAVNENKAMARDAQRIVAGMDHLCANTQRDPAEARQVVLQQLQAFPGTYDAVMAGSGEDTGHLSYGLDIDLACGPHRALGALGLDTYPHDYGVIIHDVCLGIPFEDKTVRNVWFAAPSDWDPNDTAPLLAEARRVLQPGGRLHLSGAAPPTDVWPGMQRLPQDKQAPWAHYLRVAVPIPAMAGGGMDWTVVMEDLPVEAQLALAAERDSPAELAMANLINKGSAAEVHQPGTATQAPPAPVMRALNALHARAHIIPICKADAAKQLVYGVVLAPQEIDTQNDFMDAAEIEAAAHRYLTTSRVVGSEHGAAIQATPVESFIAPVDMAMRGPHGDQTVPKGAWVLGVKVHDKELWQKVISGDYTGFSVGGFGLREDAPSA